MIRFLLFAFLLFSILDAESNTTLLQSDSVEVSILTPEGKSQTISVGRDLDRRCKELLLANHTFWSGNFADNNVPDVCKATFVTTYGQLSPMKIHDDVETYGELEVLEFIEEMQEDEEMLLIDTRKPLWFDYRTIPTAINISFEHILHPQKFAKEFIQALKMMGVHKDKNSFNFKQAKTVVFFCNASWCGQSPAVINSLIALGYPPQKIKWYRGGMASWLGLNMTATRP